MSEIDTLRRLEQEGFFERARNGDHRACGLFARLAAFTLNPSGAPAGWGCLRKTGGGQNVEGFAEDAIVLGNDPSNLNNVVDIIGGAGAPGASLGFGGFLPRRSSDVWERPVPLTAEQMKHLRPGGPPSGCPGPRSVLGDPTPAMSHSKRWARCWRPTTAKLARTECRQRHVVRAGHLGSRPRRPDDGAVDREAPCRMAGRPRIALKGERLRSSSSDSASRLIGARASCQVSHELDLTGRRRDFAQCAGAPQRRRGRRPDGLAVARGEFAFDRGPQQHHVRGGMPTHEVLVELAGTFFTSFSSSLISALVSAAAFVGAPGCQVIARRPATALDSGYQRQIHGARPPAVAR